VLGTRTVGFALPNFPLSEFKNAQSYTLKCTVVHFFQP